MRALLPPQSFHSVGWEAGCANVAVSIAKPAARAHASEKLFTGIVIAIPQAALRGLTFALASYSAIVRDGENRVEPFCGKSLTALAEPVHWPANPFQAPK